MRHPSMPSETLAILPSLDDIEYEDDEYPELRPDLIALRDIVYTRTRLRIISCQKLTRGTYHEIYILNSADGQKLIARLCRCTRGPATLRSEVATNLVRTRTSIPVPTVHLFMDSPVNDVGMQFIVMEYIEGVHLYRIWEDLTLDQKKRALTQIASVLGQLATLEFDAIGSIKEDGSVGPLLYRMVEEIDGKEVSQDMQSGPCRSTSDYLSLFIDHFSRSGNVSDEVRAQLPNVRNILTKCLASHGDKSSIRPPFRLQHPDFDAQNFLFRSPSLDDDLSPRLVGIIHWDYAHTSPLYFLHEYPIFIQDNDSCEHLYQENAILRPVFVRALRRHFPHDSARYAEARACIPSGKCSTLNCFADTFMHWGTWKNELFLSLVKAYIQEEEDGSGRHTMARLIGLRTLTRTRTLIQRAECWRSAICILPIYYEYPIFVLDDPHRVEVNEESAIFIPDLFVLSRSIFHGNQSDISNLELGCLREMLHS